MRFVTLAIFAAASLFASAHAKATTAQQLLSACRPVALAKVTEQGVSFEQTFETGLCWGTLSAAQSVIVHIDALRKRLYLVCAPEESTLTQLVSVFVAFAERNPQRLHEDGFKVVLESLQGAFPCKSRAS